MGIVVKFILKNIWEKKFRTFLMVFSIMLSAALYFASGALQNTMIKMQENRLMQYYGNAELLIQADEKSPSRFISMTGAEGMGNKLEYAIGAILLSASYKYRENETFYFTLNGIDLEDLKRFNPAAFHTEAGLYPFEGKKVVISKYAAEKFGLKTGDYLDLTIDGSLSKYRICALAESAGPFLDESQSLYAVVPRETLAAMLDARGRAGIIYVKSAAGRDKDALTAELKEIYKRYDVREPFSKEEFAQQLSSMTTPFMLMSVIVALMSIFIIYTSFKVITMERLPVIGTFRSIGATRRTTNSVLLLESLAYGVIGGAAGCALGVGVLYCLAFFTGSAMAPGFKTTIDFEPSQMAMAFVLAVVLSLVSCLLPIITISRIPVKDIVLNVMQKAVKKSPWKLAAGIFLIAASLAAPAYIPDGLALPLSSVCMVAAVAGVVLLVPYITLAFVLFLEKLYAVLFGNVGILAAKNLKGNKSIFTNISLLVIGISSLLMINTISNSVVKEVANFYRDAKFDIWMNYVQQGDRNLEGIIRQVGGVSGTYGAYQASNVEVVNGNGYRISALQGINLENYMEYWNTSFSEDSSRLAEDFNKNRSIILSNTLKEKFKLEKGDTVTLKLKETEREYKIAGFANTVYYNGSIAFISEGNFKIDTGTRFYSEVYIKTAGNPEEIKAEIQKRLSQRPNSTMTVNEMSELNRKSNDSVFNLLKAFSVMALVIGIFGILNNLVISFIQRRRALAMLRSVGMSARQAVLMIFIEALSGGVIGGIAGIIAGFIQIMVTPYVMKAINLSIPISLPYDSIAVYIAAGVLITVAASVSPALKASKLNIIEAVKYE